MIKAMLRRLQNMMFGDLEGPEAAHKLTCGTLRYTPASLMVLFGWLLWGDLVYVLMEAEPGLIVLQLKDLGVSNTAMVILTGTTAGVANMLLNPVISTYSDRYRSRWGRRRPFLLFATPFVAFFLILIPWSPEITAASMKVAWIRSFLEMFPFSPLLVVFGITIISFRVFNMFINTSYYYLIADTVPAPLMGRFYSYFRVVGITAGLLFNWFVFGHAREHIREIFAFFSILYAISFTIMCLKVREGDYPDVKEEHGHWYSPFKNYTLECFGHLRYWVIFMIGGCIVWATSAQVFYLFFLRDNIGFSMMEYGRLLAINQAIALALALPMGALVDRLGSTKALLVSLVAGSVLPLCAFFLVHSKVMACVFLFSAVPAGLIGSFSTTKWMVDQYPRAQYGQFASANSLFHSVFGFAVGPTIAWFVDSYDNFYRICYVVPVIFNVAAITGLFVLARMTRGETSPPVSVSDLADEGPVVQKI